MTWFECRALCFSNAPWCDVCIYVWSVNRTFCIRVRDGAEVVNRKKTIAENCYFLKRSREKRIFWPWMMLEDKDAFFICGQLPGWKEV